MPQNGLTCSETALWQQAQPDAGQILNSLINRILLIDDNLAIHYANPARNNCSPKAPANCGMPLPELLSYFSLNIELMQESLEAGQRFYR